MSHTLSLTGDVTHNTINHDTTPKVEDVFGYADGLPINNVHGAFVLVVRIWLLERMLSGPTTRVSERYWVLPLVSLNDIGSYHLCL
jgi:hypothetical protein